jgi:hypothetical protein
MTKRYTSIYIIVIIIFASQSFPLEYLILLSLLSLLKYYGAFPLYELNSNTDNNDPYVFI